MARARPPQRWLRCPSSTAASPDGLRPLPVLFLAPLPLAQFCFIFQHCRRRGKPFCFTSRRRSLPPRFQPFHFPLVCILTELPLRSDLLLSRLRYSRAGIWGRPLCVSLPSCRGVSLRLEAARPPASPQTLDSSTGSPPLGCRSRAATCCDPSRVLSSLPAAPASRQGPAWWLPQSRFSLLLGEDGLLDVYSPYVARTPRALFATWLVTAPSAVSLSCSPVSGYMYRSCNNISVCCFPV